MSGLKIADIELAPLHKYAGMFYDYNSASVWSAPEILSQKKNSTLVASIESDIYSYGMILWELWHETVPFDNDVAIC